MSFPLFLLVAISAIAPSFSITCNRGRDYGIGKCLEPFFEQRDWMAAWRMCHSQGMLLYYPANLTENLFLMNLANETFPKVPGIWIGVTCFDKGKCYNDNGEYIQQGNPRTAYNNFINSESVGTCTFLDATGTGLWFGDPCRETSLYRQFFCWDTQVPNQLTCPPGTVFYNYKCYGVHGLAQQQVASDHCHNVGGELVSIHSPLQNEFVYDLAAFSVPDGTDRVGIGMYVDGEGDQVWYDGTMTTYSAFGQPDVQPPDGMYPPKDSTIYMQLGGDKAHEWFGDPAKAPTYHVCSWPPVYGYNPNNFGYNVNSTYFQNYCAQGILPNGAIIYSPQYPDYTNQNCTLVYNSPDAISISFPELYIDVDSKIDIFTDPAVSEATYTILHNSDIKVPYTSETGYMRLEFRAASKNNNYWRATTIVQQQPIDFGVPATCSNQGGILALDTATATATQFQSYHYGLQTKSRTLCSVEITAKTRNSTVAVTFYDFHIGHNDEVRVYDGPVGSSEKVLTSKEPGIRIESTGQVLTFVIYPITQNFRGIWADFVSN